MTSVALSKGEIITSKWKYTEDIKKVFCRTISQILITLDTKHPWVNGIQNFSNKGSNLLISRIGKLKIIENTFKELNIFSKIPGPISSTKLGTNILWIKGTQISKGLWVSRSRYDSEIVKIFFLNVYKLGHWKYS